MKQKKRLIIFVIFFVLSFIYWRFRVFFFFKEGNLPYIREVTGLSIHHYHYGLIFILIAALLLIFYKVNSWSVGLMGFGLGSVFDAFISRLMSSSKHRALEISRYNFGFWFTALLFINIILLSWIFYLFARNGKIKENRNNVEE